MPIDEMVVFNGVEMSRSEAYAAMEEGWVEQTTLEDMVEGLRWWSRELANGWSFERLELLAKDLDLNARILERRGTLSPPKQ